MSLKNIIKKCKDAKKHREYINTVAKEANFSKSQAKKALAHAKTLGMPDFRYVKNQCWTMTDDEIVALNEKILARIKKNREADLQAETISQQTGVPTDIIKKRLKAAEKHQISESVFIKKHLWDLKDGFHLFGIY